MKPESPLLVAAGVKDPAKWLDAVVETCVEFEINTPQRIAAFLAQTAHESGGYTMLTENLNYKAATLAACWPNRFAVLGADKKRPISRPVACVAAKLRVASNCGKAVCDVGCATAVRS